MLLCIVPFPWAVQTQRERTSRGSAVRCPVLCVRSPILSFPLLAPPGSGRFSMTSTEPRAPERGLLHKCRTHAWRKVRAPQCESSTRPSWSNDRDCVHASVHREELVYERKLRPGTGVSEGKKENSQTAKRLSSLKVPKNLFCPHLFWHG